MRCSMVGLRALLVCWVIAGGLAGCGVSRETVAGSGPTTANTPEELFQGVVRSPVPAGVTDIQATGDTWQGHQLFVRFAAAPGFLGPWLASEFDAAPCDAVLDRLVLPNRTYDTFTPGWSPRTIPAPACYTSRSGIAPAWGGDRVVLVDTSSGTVYLYAIGI